MDDTQTNMKHYSETKEQSKNKLPPTPQPISMKGKLFKDECPKCGSERLDYDIMEPQNETLFQTVYCRDCNFGFSIWTPIREWFIYKEK